MTELEKIIERFERGYTATLYGTVDLANFQKEYDFMELIHIVKKLTIPNVSQQRELLSFFLSKINKDAIDLYKQGKEQIVIDHFLKNNNCG